MSSNYDVVIVGAGHGGAQAAIALRQAKFAGKIAVIGEEPDLPYERPPLSKEYFAGEKSFERILIRPAAFWAEREIDMLTGRTVDTVDPERRVVTITNDQKIGYRHLIWAAGGHARRLSCEGHHLLGVHNVRSRRDVDQLLRELPTTSRVVIIGGGYIGLEAASALVKAGKQVVLLEALDRVLARVAGPVLSAFFQAEHRAHGVDVRLGIAVEAITGSSRVSGVRLANGETVACDMVVVGIGIVPAVAPLIAAGAAGDNGIVVDAQCRTTLPAVYAVGDCALHANRFAEGRAVRLESVQNANDQATVVARVIAGQEVAYDAIPWFWSNQYDLKLQTVGLSTGYNQEIVRGDPASRSFSVAYLRDRKLVALDCVNAVKDYVQGRGLILAGAEPDTDRLRDPALPLKECVATG